MRKTEHTKFLLRSWMQRTMPVLVWLAAVACLFVLFRNRSEQFELVGIVQGQMHQIAAPVDGRLKILSVELFDQVYKGQVLAVLDTSGVDAQIAAIQAEIEHLASQMPALQDSMSAEAANLETERLTSRRQLYADVENARLRILEHRIELEADKTALTDLELEVKAASELLQTDAIAPYEVQKAETLRNALVAKIQQTEALLEEANRQLETARAECDGLAERKPVHPSVDKVFETLRRQITVQEKLIAELALQREAMNLTCPVDGTVVQVGVDARQPVFRFGEDLLRRPGEVVMAGDPILVIAESQPAEVVAYVGQELAGKVTERMPVQLIKSSHPAQVVQSQVVRVGPIMELAPQQLWRSPGVAEWGRPVLIKVPPEMKLISGESVGIKGL